MLRGGVLKSFDDKRNFGFILPDGGGSDVFVYGGSFEKAGIVPKKGQRLAYELYTLPDRRVKAVQLRAEPAL